MVPIPSSEEDVAGFLGGWLPLSLHRLPSTHTARLSSWESKGTRYQFIQGSLMDHGGKNNPLQGQTLPGRNVALGRVAFFLDICCLGLFVNFRCPKSN